MTAKSIARPLRVLFFAAAAAGVGACGPSGPEGKVTEVEGTVRLDGAPLASVSVQFLPEDSKMVGSSGKTDGNGHYVLRTGDGRPGAIVGKHKVVVRGERGDERTKTKASGPVPAIYAQATADNPLGTVDVSEAKKTGYDFELKSK